LHSADFRRAAQELQATLAEVRHHAIQSGRPQIVRVRFDDRECQVLELVYDELTDDDGTGRQEMNAASTTEQSGTSEERVETESLPAAVDAPDPLASVDTLPPGFRQRLTYQLPTQCIFSRVFEHPLLEEEDPTRPQSADRADETALPGDAPGPSAEVAGEADREFNFGAQEVALAEWSEPIVFFADGSATDMKFAVSWQHRRIVVSIYGPTGDVELDGGPPLPADPRQSENQALQPPLPQ
jgi:hypothetical protein